MDILIYLVVAALIISKFLDCYTTQLRITSINDETNPLGRWFMNKPGTVTGIWLIFLISVIIIGLSAFLLISLSNERYYQILFILIGTVISIIQFAVAHSNFTGTDNSISSKLKKIKYYRMKI
jgi:hypothetical protein